MSEFQCHKFKSIDRPLTESERREVDALSSRGHVTSNSATFIYHYSNFRHQPETVLEKYFDAYLYFTNWGTKQLMFRLPADMVDSEALWKYCYEEEYGSSYLKVRRRGDYYLLDFYISDDEGGGWMEEEDYDLGDLGPIREDILRGDYRALYLMWAKLSQPYHDEDDEMDEDDSDDEMDEDDSDDEMSPPPIPPNMKRLTGALKGFIDFFEIDKDLVAAAQSTSADHAAIIFDHEKLIAQLPEKERVDWLNRLLKGEPRLDVLLKKRLEKLVPVATIPSTPTVTPAQLLAQRKIESQLREQREAVAAKAAHLSKMKKLAAAEETHWKSVDFNLSRKTGKSYELATDTLKDLKELAEHENKVSVFRKKLADLREQYGRSWALMQRWEKAGLFK